MIAFHEDPTTPTRPPFENIPSTLRIDTYAAQESCEGN